MGPLGCSDQSQLGTNVSGTSFSSTVYILETLGSEGSHSKWENILPHLGPASQDGRAQAGWEAAECSDVSHGAS